MSLNKTSTFTKRKPKSNSTNLPIVVYSLRQKRPSDSKYKDDNGLLVLLQDSEGRILGAVLNKVYGAI